MSEAMYQVFSLALRWVFAGLGITIAVCACLWLRRSRVLLKRKLRTLPDSGFLGELLVIQGSEELPDGTVLPLPFEGSLGCLRTCDLYIPCPGVAPQHLDLRYQPGEGMLVQLRRGLTCLIDDEEMTFRDAPHHFTLKHGTVLTVGEARLQFRFFYGLEIERGGHLMPDVSVNGDADEPDDTAAQEQSIPQPGRSVSPVPDPIIQESPFIPPVKESRHFVIDPGWGTDDEENDLPGRRSGWRRSDDAEE